MGKTIIRQTKNGPRPVPLFKYIYFQPDCFKKWYSHQEKDWKANPFKTRKPPKQLEGKLKKINFTPEQRRRRHTIQLYLSNKFRKQLIMAYKKQNPQRVIEIQNRMMDYIKELESFGPGLKLQWLDLDGEGCKGSNLELHQLVKLYDRKWLEQLWTWRENRPRWEQIFRRQDEGIPAPTWRIE